VKEGSQKQIQGPGPLRSAAPEILVVGAGLAGCEAAWQAARRGAYVTLVEMKPAKMSPAHQSPDMAELVCSNSLRGASLQNAVGLLKEEMRRLDSLIIAAADASAVPAGGALAVDRKAFSRSITEAIESHPRICVEHRVVSEIPEEPHVILATGPLTDCALADSIQQLMGDESLYFYDAIAPTVYADSIDHAIAFRASRYQEGEGDYLNLPLDSEQYENFVAELVAADTVPLHQFEAALYFEGCLPIEEMARRGKQTLAFGPLKPVGLRDPRTEARPHAVVQLRHEDKEGVLYNLVGFQTKLRIADQRRILRSLPGMTDAVFARYGTVHRNTYINAPKQLLGSLESRLRPGLYFAGQMAGVEGYVESTALGFVAGVNASHAVQDLEASPPPGVTAHGVLIHHLGHGNPDNFQPMNVNYGLFPRLDQTHVDLEAGRRRKLKRKEKRELLAQRALEALATYRDEINGLLR
jgi:methylenetetrahydrofolate--tRNA-(uracil-5-)-methyltransferase